MRIPTATIFLSLLLVGACDRDASVTPNVRRGAPRAAGAPGVRGPNAQGPNSGAAGGAGPRAAANGGAPSAQAGLAAGSQPAGHAAGGHVTVTQIVISFKDVAGTKATRTKEEAEKLANELFTKAQGNSEPFAALRKQTDEAGTPIFNICLGKEKKSPNDKLRSEVPAAVGDAAFQMQPNDVKLIPYDAAKAPGGFYIIKRMNNP
ncbi:MAG: hypothetical protein HY286_18070 [Planctomycetes bacterium]|nr:hypothetical protein [Planctomycetota bacterium]